MRADHPLSRTTTQQVDSRNQNPFRAFATLKALLRERPLVLDREFSYLDLLLYLGEGIRFVIRPHLGSHPPRFWDSEGREVSLEV
ncbi:MAG: transposase, partial [Anaerolineae bacterium]|nr:transposase [Anaerolineae bacterium]